MALNEENNLLLDFDVLRQTLIFSPSSNSVSWALSPGNAGDSLSAIDTGEISQQYVELENVSEDQLILSHADKAQSFTRNFPAGTDPATLTTDASNQSSSAAGRRAADTEGDEQNTSSSSGSQSVDMRSPDNQPRWKKTAGRGQIRRSKLPPPATSTNTLPPCRVCADPASGFHYGVNSCEACKRFFRRALKRKRNFKCRGNKNCTIKGKRTSLCGYCRYKRCLAVGMSKTNIKTGRYTHEKRAQNLLEVQRIGTDSNLTLSETEVDDIVQNMVSAHARVISNLNIPREEMHREAVRVREEFLLKKEMFGIEEVLTPDQYDEIFRATGLDIDERKKRMETVAKCIDRFVKGYVRFGKSVPGFGDLPLNDQANLLKLARVEVWFLCAFRGFFHDMDIFYPPSRSCITRNEMVKLLGPDYTRCAFRLAAALQKLELTTAEVIVLQGVCLTYSDRCVLEDAARVEAVQWRMLCCFRHLLKKNHSDKAMFYKVVSWMTAVRNLTELSKAALKNTHFSEAIQSNSTLGDMIIVTS